MTFFPISLCPKLFSKASAKKAVPSPIDFTHDAVNVDCLYNKHLDVWMRWQLKLSGNLAQILFVRECPKFF